MNTFDEKYENLGLMCSIRTINFKVMTLPIRRRKVLSDPEISSASLKIRGSQSLQSGFSNSSSWLLTFIGSSRKQISKQRGTLVDMSTTKTRQQVDPTFGVPL